MWKITKSLTNLENKIKTRKDRKLALKNAKTNYKNLVKSIKKSSSPSEFLQDGKTQEEQILSMEEVKTEKVLQKSVTLFISPKDTKKNRLAILNAYKKYQVSVSIVASRGRDYFVKPTKTENSDKFNEVTKTLEPKLNGYGVRITGFERIYNQGGKTL